MQAVAYDAAMLRTQPDGTLARSWWEASARLGNADAIERLRFKPVPESLAYLYEWFGDLSAGRGEGVNGVAPLTWRDLQAWSEETGERPAPHESRALLRMDAAWRRALRDDPAEEKPPAKANEPTELRPVKAWPSKAAVS